MSDSWAELQKERELRGRMADELRLLEMRFADLRINNKGTHSKLKKALAEQERLQTENDSLRKRIKRYEAIIAEAPARRLP